jgi:hypothetical protein
MSVPQARDARQAKTPSSTSPVPVHLQAGTIPDACPLCGQTPAPFDQKLSNLLEVVGLLGAVVQDVKKAAEEMQARRAPAEAPLTAAERRRLMTSWKDVAHRWTPQHSRDGREGRP